MLGRQLSLQAQFSGTRYEIAIPFTTGTNTLGYHVTSVLLNLRRGSTSSISSPQVTIRNDKAGSPGETVLYALTTYSAITSSSDFRLLMFTTTDDNLLLPNTTYWLYVTTVGTNGMTILTTTSDGEDSNSEADWQSGSTVGRVDGGAWIAVANRHLGIGIRGHAATQDPLVSNLGQSGCGRIRNGYGQHVRTVLHRRSGPRWPRLPIPGHLGPLPLEIFPTTPMSES